MTIAILYVATAVAFFALDFVGLKFLIKPLFERELGDLLLDKPRIAPAVIFYLAYVGGLLLFVSVPAIRSGAGLGHVFVMAALFGAVCYGAYEFTNYATLKAWSFRMVAADLAWGAFLNGVAAVAGVAFVRAVWTP